MTTMRIYVYAALLVVTSCVLLTGLAMPDTPRPERHARSRVQTLIDERAARQRQQPRVSTQTKKAREAAREARRNAPPLEDATGKDKRKQAERSARILLPSKRLR